jgi:hypothetical protein
MSAFGGGFNRSTTFLIASAMSAFGGKADIDLTPRNVCFWHKADITAVLIHVRFWGYSRSEVGILGKTTT